MTSLIDVIFLLLLFFMLSSTFSRFSEVELSSAGAGSSGSSDVKSSFLQLGAETLRLNGQEVEATALAATLAELTPEADSLPVIVSLDDDVTAQRLTDVLVVLRGIEGISLRVLGS